MADPTDITTLLGDVVQHRKIPPAQIHNPYAWIVPNAAAKDEIVLTPDDKFKFLYQIDTQESMMVNEFLQWTSIVDVESMRKFSIAMSIVFGGVNV